MFPFAGVNLYLYVHNNPVNATDPSGAGEVRGWDSLSDREKLEVTAKSYPRLAISGGN